MIIKLLPNPPHPTVLFELVFHDLQESLPTPPAWLEQLRSLNSDDLELPSLMHSLDKASALPSLLEQVVFDVPSLTISCRFIDGSCEEWPLMEASCLKCLESVIHDVNESALEIERQKELACLEDSLRQREYQERQQQQTALLNSPPPTVKTFRHKKQRSLLMSLVTSILPLSSSSFSFKSSSRSSSPILPSFSLSAPPPPPPSTFLPTGTVPSALSLTPKILRRRARSNLVEAFRLHVQRKLVARMPTGGYYTWAAQSLLRRVSQRLYQLVQSAEARGSNSPPHAPEDKYYLQPTSSNPFPSDEDGEVDTDTDGSSVHTPSSQHYPSQLYFVQGSPTNSSISSSSGQRNLTGKDLAEYQHLSHTSMRLRHLLVMARAREIHADNENTERESILEVRSRRRAWLNKSLVRTAHSSSMDAGLAMPFHRSPLGLSSWSGDAYVFVSQCEEYLDAETEHKEEYGEYEERMTMGSRRLRGRSDAKLFPVSEEDEDLDEQEYELQWSVGVPGLDMVPEEVGSAQLLAALDVGAPRLRPRTRPRTRSMRFPNKTPTDIGTQPALLASTILCRPLSESIGEPPGYTHFDSSVEVGEFTLAMDAPLSVGIDNNSVIALKSLERPVKAQGTDALQVPLVVVY